MKYSMDDLLSMMLEEDASDLHIKPGSPPGIRIHGELMAVEEMVLPPQRRVDVRETRPPAARDLERGLAGREGLGFARGASRRREGDREESENDRRHEGNRLGGTRPRHGSRIQGA